MMNDHDLSTSTNGLNRLRAAVLGANDGIVSTAGLVLGVAGAALDKEAILLTGFAGLVAGALSMAAGEFVSVSSQRDSEKAFLKRSKLHIQKQHHDSLSAEFIELYMAKGISEDTATRLANEFQKNGTLSLELEREFGIDSEDFASPWQAAGVSLLCFAIGAGVPLLAIAVSGNELLVPMTFLAVLLSLVLTGTLSAYAGKANRLRAALRVVILGVVTMIVTYLIGLAFGVSVAG